MTNEKLGVLVNDRAQYFMKLELYAFNHFTAEEYAIFTEKISEAYKCTQEEAKKYPQFRWVSLEEL